MSLTMEQAIKLVKEHDERACDYSLSLLHQETHSEREPSCGDCEDIEDDRLLLSHAARKLLEALTDTKPTDDEVEEAIYG